MVTAASRPKRQAYLMQTLGRAEQVKQRVSWLEASSPETSHYQSLQRCSQRGLPFPPPSQESVLSNLESIYLRLQQTFSLPSNSSPPKCHRYQQPQTNPLKKPPNRSIPSIMMRCDICGSKSIWTSTVRNKSALCGNNNHTEKDCQYELADDEMCTGSWYWDNMEFFQQQRHWSRLLMDSHANKRIRNQRDRRSENWAPTLSTMKQQGLNFHRSTPTYRISPSSLTSTRTNLCSSSSSDQSFVDSSSCPVGDPRHY